MFLNNNNKLKMKVKNYTLKVLNISERLKLSTGKQPRIVAR